MGESGTRAGLYERVSVLAKGDDARSVEEQNAANVAACTARGWEVAERYADPGRSASRFATRVREEYARMAADVSAGRLDVVVMWESSRGGRELEEWARLLNSCRGCGVLIYVTSHDRLYDMRNGRDWRSLAEDGVDSAYDSEKKSAQLKRAMAANAAAGRPHGSVLFGYERIYDERTRKLAEQRPDPATAWIPREVITRAAAGEPVTAIAKDMRRRGVPSPRGGAWHGALVRRMAMRPAYIGKRRSAGELVDAVWPAIVDAETFHAATRILTDPGRVKITPGAAQHLLSYLAVCGKCGLGLSVSRGRHLDHPMYRCHMTGCVAIREDWLDEYVLGLTAGALGSAAFWAEMAAGDDAAVLAARAKASALRQRLREHRREAIAGRISAESFGQIEAGILELAGRADAEAELIAVPPVLRGLRPGGREGAVSFLSRPLAVRKQVIRALFAEVAILPAIRRGRVKGFDPDRVRVKWREVTGTR